MRSLRVAAMVAVAVLIVSACSSSDSGDEQSEGSPESTEVELQTGDCYNDSPVEGVEIVPCDTPHDYEVVLYAPLTEDDLPSGTLAVPFGEEPVLPFTVPPEGEEALAECLGVSVAETDAALEERALRFAFNISQGTHELSRADEAGNVVPGGLEEAICP